MPVLGSSDPLPAGCRRVLVAGASGSGKTTLARRIGQAWSLPHTEIDGLYHGPNWTPRSSFARDVGELVAGESWVTEWQYRQVRDMLASRAQLMVWLDLPRATIMRQVTARTLRRRIRRQVLWNGNVEQGLWRILVDREHIIRWAWTSYPTTGTRVAQVRAAYPELPIVRLTSRAEVDAWLAGPVSVAVRCGGGR